MEDSINTELQGQTKNLIACISMTTWCFRIVAVCAAHLIYSKWY